MGHVHLGVLPNTVKWRAVVDLLTEGAADDAVISSSAIAVERELRHASDDPGFVEAVRLLAMIPQAARTGDFGRALRDLGIPAPDGPDLLQIVTAVGDRLDRVMRDSGQASDFAELSRRSLLAALSNGIGDGLPGLFGATSEEVQTATARLGHSRDFSALARAYFGRLLAETLSSYLDRTLSTHVGPGQRFDHMGERTDFDAALRQYCSEATRVIREFASGWYRKTLHRDGEVHTQHAAVFGAVAFKKIGEELRRKRGVRG